VGNFRFEQMLDSSGLPEGERRDLSTIFSALPAARQAKVIDQWETELFPKLLEVRALAEEQRNEILAQSVRRLKEIRDQLAMMRQEAADRKAADELRVAEGSAAYDASRAAKAQSDQMAKIRAMAAGTAAAPAPVADPLAQAAASGPAADPLAALS